MGGRGRTANNKNKVKTRRNTASILGYETPRLMILPATLLQELLPPAHATYRRDLHDLRMGRRRGRKGEEGEKKGRRRGRRKCEEGEGKG